MKKVIFFNHFHNGDIHLSRGLVKYVSDFFIREGFDCYYFHKNYPGLLKDLQQVKFTSKCNLQSEKILSQKQGDTIYLSTWYGANSFEFINKFGITFNCLYHIFENHIQTYLPNYLDEFLKVDKKTLFPEIDYSYYNISSINNWILRDDRKKVLISNGQPLSGQSYAINFDTVINELSENFSDILFIPTNKTKIAKDNVIMSTEIIGKTNSNDLIENSYLSTFCDIIVGSWSGPYSFSFTTHNLFYRDCTFISFSNLGTQGSRGLWYDDNDFVLNYSAKVIDSSINNIDTIIEMVSKEIRRIKNV